MNKVKNNLKELNRNKHEISKQKKIDEKVK